jgi:hypothetical protein
MTTFSMCTRVKGLPFCGLLMIAHTNERTLCSFRILRYDSIPAIPAMTCTFDSIQKANDFTFSEPGEATFGHQTTATDANGLLIEPYGLTSAKFGSFSTIVLVGLPLSNGVPFMHLNPDNSLITFFKGPVSRIQWQP